LWIFVPVVLKDFKAEGRLSAVFLFALWHLSLRITSERGGMPQRCVSNYYPFWAPPPLLKGWRVQLRPLSAKSITQNKTDVNGGIKGR
jgi:hypothetical protein